MKNGDFWKEWGPMIPSIILSLAAFALSLAAWLR